MKKFTLEELPDAVTMLHEKMECIEMLLKEKGYRYKDRSQNYLLKEKCSSHYNKNDLAQLFYILMDEKILFFDDKCEKYNRSKMQQFIEGNFTYTGDAGLQVSIDTISKQFSESKGFTYGEKQLKFLDKIIWLFQKRREKLAGR
ncbi:hypothetical protein FNW52_15690 [Flavobacterium sp. ZT3R18]|uniref:hypothetical protein n=1 Tax=Flavobacterium sp. ZT3R18 TaxID=2594429 RepID=UPI00117B2FE5|nr:hypothetical protein [Flavobacterium sp. ZT3R18]TRX33202.1 hypothetical protein FNW52_15690 [Flavobacterium sp. ZT3R18]